MNEIRFGTGGWRAIIADGFTKENIRRLSAGLCAVLQKDGLQGSTLCVGYDRRFLSKESAHWAAEVFAGCGFNVCMIDRSSPTPLIMYVVKERALPCGIAVTASHNPAIYNGIKVFTAGGRDADPDFTARIEAEIARIDPEKIASVDYDDALAAGSIVEENPANEYIDSILSMIDTDAIRRAQLHIALDPMYGVGRTCLSAVLTTCRCDIDVIHDRHDTLFGGRLPAPTANTLGALTGYVREHHCDLGIATDGDADRLGVIDADGKYVTPNQLLALLYYYLLKYRGWRGDCVRNNSTTHLLDRIAAHFGMKSHEVPVGFKYISAKMTETDAIIGGESSGGMTVRGHISGKDGIYSAALLAEMLAVTGKPISELYAEICAQFGESCCADAEFAMTPARKAELKRILLEDRQRPEFENVARVSYEDGCKLYFSDGAWVICRFSGTEPLLRIASEADTAEAAQRLINCWKEFLEL